MSGAVGVPAGGPRRGGTRELVLHCAVGEELEPHSASCVHRPTPSTNAHAVLFSLVRSWMVGFLVPTAAFAIAITCFIAGTRWYKHKPPGGSPLNRWCRVVAGSFAHWKAKVPEDARLVRVL